MYDLHLRIAIFKIGYLLRKSHRHQWHHCRHIAQSYPRDCWCDHEKVFGDGQSATNCLE